jgi:hypothetical protein
MSLTSHQDDLQGSEFGPPRFSLRTLLLTMTAVGCLFGLMSAVGATWSLLLLFFLCLVLAHVVGNSLGTKLRDRAGRRVEIDDLNRAEAGALRPLEIAMPGRLTQHTRLSRITPIMSIGGALIGGTLGGTRFSEMYPDSGLAAVALGVISSAVLGSFAGFATSSFLSVARQALGEALGEGDPAAGRASHKPH